VSWSLIYIPLYDCIILVAKVWQKEEEERFRLIPQKSNAHHCTVSFFFSTKKNFSRTVNLRGQGIWNNSKECKTNSVTQGFNVVFPHPHNLADNGTMTYCDVASQSTSTEIYCLLFNVAKDYSTNLKPTVKEYRANSLAANTNAPSISLEHI
jgi:hypothetical protein